MHKPAGLDILRGATHFECWSGHPLEPEDDHEGPWWHHPFPGKNSSTCWLYGAMGNDTGDLPLAVEVYDDP